MAEKYLVAGLGNPGKKYQNTRHNVGFMAIDYISKTINSEKFKLKFKSQISVANIANKEVILLKPETFMNLSGSAVLECINFYKIPIENIIIIFDDVSLNIGKVRYRSKGSSGGQNGIKHIISMLGTEEIARIKIGVGEKPHKDYNLADWVLSEFKKDDNINDAIVQAYDLLVDILKKN